MKEYWISNSRFKFIVLTLMVIFFTLMVLFYLKADEITKDPCSVCAERYDEPIVCTIPGQPIFKHFEPNGDVYINKVP